MMTMSSEAYSNTIGVSNNNTKDFYRPLLFRKSSDKVTFSPQNTFLLSTTRSGNNNINNNNKNNNNNNHLVNVTGLPLHKRESNNDDRMSPPGAEFFNDMNTNAGHGDNEETIRNQLLFKDRPLVIQKSFWLQNILPAAIIAAAACLTSLAYCWAIKMFKESHWLGKMNSNWIWLLCRTTIGGFVSGLLLLVLSRTSDNSVSLNNKDNIMKSLLQASSIIHSSHSRTFLEYVCIIIGSLVAILSGAPLGPELALFAIGAITAKLLFWIICQVLVLLQQQQQQQEQQYFLQQQWILSGQVGALTAACSKVSSFDINPLIVVLCVYELYLSQHSFMHYTGTIPKTRGAESILAFCTACAIAFSLAQAIPIHHINIFEIPFMAATTTTMTIDNVANCKDTVTMYYLIGMAVLVGFICGGITTIIVALTNLLYCIRAKIIQYFDPRQEIIVIITLSTLAGLIQGLLIMQSLSIMSIGGMEQSQSSMINSFGIIGITSLTMCICLGFGMIGGPTNVLVLMGVWIGKFLSINLLQSHMFFIPCCVAACICTVVPMPISTSFCILLVFTQLDGNNNEDCVNEEVSTISICIVIASMVAQACFDNCWCMTKNDNDDDNNYHFHHEDRINNVGQGETMDESDDEYSMEPPPFDHEIVRDVRETIFGTK